MTATETLTLAEIETLAQDALVAAGTSPENAAPLAKATAMTEADGVASHGLAYIPIYAEHVQCGKVDGNAKPVLSQPKPSVVTVDAATGFAHAAIDMGFEKLIPAAKEQGVAVLAINNSYNCGVLGVHTQRLAQAGLMAIGFTNAPASIAPTGGAKPVVGTNPFSVAAPGPDGRAEVLIDQSASTIAKSEVMKHAREGKPVPEGWVLDADGNPTTDPEAGLKGSMVPSGGYKGVGIALMVEMMAAAMSGATLGKDASPFSGTKGGPPKTGQFFIAIDPDATSGGAFAQQLAALTEAVRAEDGVRVPGDGRGTKRVQAAQDGVAVNAATLEKIRAIL
ncbi:(2R)-3-sulfolactate dehydrogenase (NADP+) [Aliiroseovarius halocynthiae]|uniref:Ldh family oxidoreductase n=1 Tax=Aliiroseovarius halocynthiae TaxID=985055 RepID=A0A545SSF7_9RHOB|nr:Ldh family oxidoreductase [Aliiroseovarius halocynthiae]TQV67856.1 Ldh family oxidoreductase [Aliiroseovarius halocynthiae]SMR72948.1 (2R)-3-sulfolactate dehydrogenase (NADP+) [Aliiroseovarius halocynthiae]